MTEWSVAWAWHDRMYSGGPSPVVGKEKRKLYKTEKGARAFHAKLTSNGGKFVWRGEEMFSYSETWHLAYARLETREVTAWTEIEP